MAGQERREAILDAAIQLFSERGFRGTTTRELAAAVGVSEPTLYQHFATKSELYSAIIDLKSTRGEEKFGRLLDEARESNDDRTYFRALATTILRWYTEEPSFVRLLLYSALEGHELSTLCYERQASILHQRVAGYIKRRMELGALREMDPAVTARAFICMIAHYAQAGVIFRCHPVGVVHSPESDVESMIEIFLGGISRNQEK
jgi:AcrR family transcriptional regulator